MLDEKKPGSFIAAMKHFFGFLPGQSMTDFGAEVKSLSVADRDYFTRHLRAAGYPLP